MATKYAPDAHTKLIHTGDHGNTVTYVYEAELAAGNGDVLRYGKIPGGTRVTNLRIITADTGGTSTIDVGFAPVSGSSPTADAKYWFDDKDTSGQANDATSASLPVLITADVWLEVLANGAFTGTPKVTIIVTGINEGVK
jgi:hypothetical protein